MNFYLFVGVLAFLFNFLSLAIVASVRKLGLKKLLTNPAFVIGDFILIPIYFALVWEFITRNLVLAAHINLLVLIVLFFASGLIVFGLGGKFRLLKEIWLLHGVFAWIIIFLLLLVIFVSLINNLVGFNLIFAAGWLLVINQVLGYFFPKKL